MGWRRGGAFDCGTDSLSRERLLLGGFEWAVEIRIERGVVVHLHLAVDFEQLAAGEQVVEQLGERVGQIGVLLAATAEALVDFLAVGEVDVGADRLLFKVIDPQSHDRETVDRGARRFGIEAGADLRNDGRGGEHFDERFVDSFDGVVALLVVAVDGPLDFGDAAIGGVGAAGDVFLVPEQVVELVLLADDGEQAVVGIIEVLAGASGRRCRGAAR